MTQTTESAGSVVPAKRVPQSLLSPYRDLLFVVGSVPLWWFLGLEQFVYPLLLLVPTVKVLFAKRSIYVNGVLVWLSLFFMAFMLSGLFIVEADRLLTFAKNGGTYVAAILLLIVVPSTVTTLKRLRGVLTALIISMTISSLLGLLAVIGVARPEVHTVVGVLLPPSLEGTALGQNISVRSFGWQSWFAGLGNYFRVSGTFLWPTSYAPALVLTLPVCWLLTRRSAFRATRFWFGVAALLLLVNLVFTTGRVAIVALVVGLIYWFFVGSPRMPLVTRALGAIAIGVALTLTIVDNPGRFDYKDQVETLVFARGTGSPTSRLTIYQKTLEGFLQRPLLGWGTERNIPDVSESFIYPAGSHSYYLGVLYRHGAFGFVVFVLLWRAIWRSTVVGSATGRAIGGDTIELREFLRLGQSVVLSAAVMAITLAFDLDAALMFVWWVVIACFVASKRLLLWEDASNSRLPKLEGPVEPG